jgi:hypothetical protein
VNIVKEGDEILIYERFSGDLIFEYSKTRPADITAYREFDDLWKEITSSFNLYPLSFQPLVRRCIPQVEYFLLTTR